MDSNLVINISVVSSLCFIVFGVACLACCKQGEKTTKDKSPDEEKADKSPKDQAVEMGCCAGGGSGCGCGCGGGCSGGCGGG